MTQERPSRLKILHHKARATSQLGLQSSPTKELVTHEFDANYLKNKIKGK
jgi:hypothetical protein